jgi:hypothetical protein
MKRSFNNIIDSLTLISLVDMRGHDAPGNWESDEGKFLYIVHCYLKHTKLMLLML